MWKQVDKHHTRDEDGKGQWTITGSKFYGEGRKFIYIVYCNNIMKYKCHDPVEAKQWVQREKANAVQECDGSED